MIRQLVPSEFCLKCKGCCRFSERGSVWLPALLEEEAAYGSGGKKIKVIAGEGGFLCSFLNPSDNKCRVYLKRPLECQLYPFLINRQEKKVFLAVDLNCPFAAAHLTEPEFQGYLAYLKDFLNTPSQREVFKKNPQVLQSYQGVRNLLPLGIEP